MMPAKVATLVSVVLAFASVALGSERGWFGMTAGVDGSGFFLNPTVKSATITKVVANSPAAEQKLAVGDEIVEVEGRAVAGSKAKEIQPLMQKSVGGTLHLRLKRKSGQLYSAALVAAPQPK